MNQNKNRLGDQVKSALLHNIVTLLFIIICVFGIIAAAQPASYILSEVTTRVFRNLVLILSLLVPVWAGLGLNFSIVLGAMSVQAGLIIATNFNITGISNLVVAFVASIPISIVLGILTGRLFNRTKGQEMITGMILGFFAQGVYNLIFMYLCGPVIPIKNQALLLTSGIGLITPINLDEGAAGAINNLWKLPLKTVLMILVLAGFVISLLQVLHNADWKPGQVAWKKAKAVWGWLIGILVYFALITFSETASFALGFTQVPMVTAIIVVVVCAFVTFLGRTKLGSDINAVGQQREIAATMGIPVNRIRIIAVVISTVLAALGQLIYIQEIGNFTTYTAHENVGTFAIAALLVGGASITKATIGQVIIGAILFHTMFVVAPLAGKNIFGDAMVGEYFRVFACYVVIAIALALYAWKRKMEKEQKK